MKLRRKPLIMQEPFYAAIEKIPANTKNNAVLSKNPYLNKITQPKYINFIDG